MEKAVLVGIKFKNEKIPLEESISESKALCSTAGANVLHVLTQNRTSPDIKFFIGKGKVDELLETCKNLKPDMVVIDHEISSSQARNLEEVLGIKVIDRTELIIDIFAQHAHSKEGKLQVELAQSSFLLSRLAGHGVSMSRLGGGIGTRGPGETKLEYDRRRVRKRISELKKELEKVRKERSLRREKRKSSRLLTATLVGYTNSGKSTLLNSLSEANILAEDKLFATLDPTIRRIYLPGGAVILLTDTVGFIQKLPHQLIAAFRATLEEVTEADLLLHVVDASHPYFEDQIDAVYNVLEELKCVTKPIITVFNKVDSLEKKFPGKLLNKYQPAVTISALHRRNLDGLYESLVKQLEQTAN
jgi:GTP-binding protein HflX